MTERPAETFDEEHDGGLDAYFVLAAVGDCERRALSDPAFPRAYLTWLIEARARLDKLISETRAA